MEAALQVDLNWKSLGRSLLLAYTQQHPAQKLETSLQA